MKAWKHISGLMIVAMLALGACSKKDGGGSSNSDNTAGGTCVTDSTGACTGGTGGSGYLGQGDWRGTVEIRNAELFRRFMIEAGMCYEIQTFRYDPRQQGGCVFHGAMLRLTLQNGFLPSQNFFSLKTWYNGYFNTRLNRNARTFLNAGSKGFLMEYLMSPYYGGPQPPLYNGAGPQMVPPYPHHPYPQRQSSLRINATFADSSRTLVNVVMSHNGTVIATGVLRGYLYNYGYPGY